MSDSPDQIHDEVIQQLRKLRAEQGFTLRELAARADIDRSYVGLLEKGKRRPTLLVLLKIAQALGYSLSQVMAMAEESANQADVRKDSHPLPESGRESALLLGEEIRRKRRKAGMSQRQLASKAKLSPRDLSSIERNRMSPTIDTLFRICQILGTQISALISGVERNL